MIFFVINSAYSGIPIFINVLQYFHDFHAGLWVKINRRFHTTNKEGRIHNFEMAGNFNSDDQDQELLKKFAKSVAEPMGWN